MLGVMDGIVFARLAPDYGPSQSVQTVEVLKSVNAVRSLAAVLLFGVALYAFNVAGFSWWAAGGPPVQNPAYYERWGVGMFIVGCLCLVGGFVILLSGRRR